MNFLARVFVTLKPTVNDPQGLTVLGGLHALGYGEVSGARMGKYLELRLDAASKDAASARVSEMCRRLLANPVVEDFSFDVEPI